jgi:regulator of protease activity HflC (stomatin/prohibitin superfamily)
MSGKGIFTASILGIIGLLAISAFFGAFYTIDQGERGVILTNGRATGVADPGLGYKLPFVQGVVSVSVQSHTVQYGITNKVESYSKDQQPANIIISVNYHVPPDKVVELYSQYGTVDNLLSRLVERKLLDEFKTVFGTFKAAEAISDRGRLNSAVLDALRRGIIGPVLIDSVQIEDISFTDAYEAGIEAKQLAEVKVAQIQQQAAQAEQEAKITVIKANADRDAAIAQATGKAQATELAGKAEATAIAAKGQALKDNPQLTGLVLAEKWNGTLPTSMIPGGTVPFLNVNPTPVN